jgi:hypothetical protein
MILATVGKHSGALIPNTADDLAFMFPETELRRLWDEGNTEEQILLEEALRLQKTRPCGTRVSRAFTNPWWEAKQ